MSDRRTALVTGSTDGLGFAIADGLARAGYDVTLTGLETAQTMAPLASDMEAAHGVRVFYHQADLADPGATGRLFDAVGPVDVLVNNAVTRHFAPVDEFPVEAWNRALAVNLTAPFLAIRLALPGMRARGWGRIVNLASVYSHFATPNRIDYVTTKTGLLGLTRTVALEVAGADITCNAICPGTLPTPAILSRIAGIAARTGVSQREAEAAYLDARQPGGRFISMEAVVALTVFLCGPQARDINGAALPVDAGWTAA